MKSEDFKRMMQERNKVEIAPIVETIETAPIETPEQLDTVTEATPLNPTFDKIKSKRGRPPIKQKSDKDVLFMKRWLLWLKTNTEKVWYKEFCIINNVDFKKLISKNENNNEFASIFNRILDIQEHRAVEAGTKAKTNSSFYLNMLINTNDWKRSSETVVNNEVNAIPDGIDVKARQELEVIRQAQRRDRRDMATLNEAKGA
jgi:hypothetical protein